MELFLPVFVHEARSQTPEECLISYLQTTFQLRHKARKMYIGKNLGALLNLTENMKPALEFRIKHVV